MSISNEDLSLAIKNSLNEVDSFLIKELDGRKLSNISKLPYKLASINYSLLFRSNRLAIDSFELFKDDNFLSSGILTRSLMESVSVLFHVSHKIKKSILNFDFSSFSSFRSSCFGMQSGSSASIPHVIQK